MMTRNRATIAIVVVCTVLVVGAFALASGNDGDLTSGETHHVEVPDTIEALHEEDYTGTNVTLGVIDVADVSTDNPAVDERLVEYRTFGESAEMHRSRPDEHGTATTLLAGGVAPDAELYFAGISDEQTFAAAVEWLLDEEVDILVAPISFYGKPNDGTSFVERAATEAAESGTVFVSPAGNVGQAHWNGRFLPADTGHQSFEGATRNQLHGESEDVVLWLSWTDPAVDFTLELYRENETEPVARSRPYDGDGYPNERLVSTVDTTENISFALRGEEAGTGTSVTVTSPTHEFEVAHRGGSLLPPGTAHDVLTVGAYDATTGIVEPFSAAGPTRDGRTGVDVVAPGRFEMTGPGEFDGTSAAAPYVSGVVALLLEADPTLDPDDVLALLRETATDTPPYDDTHRVGGGRLNPATALEHTLDGRNSTTPDVPDR